MQITSKAVNLNNNNSQRENPSLIPHVPKLLYNRCHAIEKLACQIRLTDKDNIQTNARLANTDFLLRARYKGDSTSWNMVVLLEIPEYIQKSDFSYHKVEDPPTAKNSTAEIDNKQTEKTKKNSHQEGAHPKPTLVIRHNRLIHTTIRNSDKRNIWFTLKVQ